MILLAVALGVAPGLAAECDPAEVLDRLKTGGARADYMCVVESDQGRELLVAELLKDPTGKNERLTRALALWLLERTDKPMDPAVVDRLSAGDRRLLADGIRARRGRPSPSPEHAAVFEQFDWYAPVANYTDARLRPIDRENLAVVDPILKAPPPEPAEQAPAVVAPGKPDVTAETPNACGCDAGGSATGLLIIGIAGALLGGRRRRG